MKLYITRHGQTDRIFRSVFLHSRRSRALPIAHRIESAADAADFAVLYICAWDCE